MTDRLRLGPDDLRHAAMFPAAFSFGVRDGARGVPLVDGRLGGDHLQFTYEVGRTFGAEMRAADVRAGRRLDAVSMALATACRALHTAPPGVRVVAVDVPALVCWAMEGR